MADEELKGVILGATAMAAQDGHELGYFVESPEPPGGYIAFWR